MFKFFGRSSKKVPSSTSITDREDEGFVLVGETSSERHHHTTWYRDAPPPYPAQVCMDRYTCIYLCELVLKK